ncbi:MAG: hypothetical protein AAGC46_14380 [Solirubrobacteraceae bacterium]|nr:hypothetical protein [Patulibacter sp.]
MAEHTSGDGQPTHRWTRARPSVESSGPPGLAALLDAERSALREYHLRLRDTEEARVELRRGQDGVSTAARTRLDAGRQASGMRGRFRARPADSATMLDEARQRRAALSSRLEAENARLGAAQQRLANVRGLVDSIAGLETATIQLVEPIRRSPVLPPRAVYFASGTAYVDANPQRAVADFHARDAAGEAIGDLWTLEANEAPWLTTRWRAYWRSSGDPCAGEVYAEQADAGSRRHAPVWLLGTVPHLPKPAAALAEAASRTGERNSLALLAFTVSTVLNG